MKRKFISIIILLVSILLVACANENTTDWKSTKHDVVNNFEGVSMNPKKASISSTELTVIFDNKSDKQVMYSEDILLEKKIDGDWYQVPTIIDDYGFNDIAYVLPPATKEELTIDWEWLYGSLDNGEYRIVKTVWNVNDSGGSAEYYLAAQFLIE